LQRCEYPRRRLGEVRQVDVLVRDARLGFQARHDGVVQVPFGREVAIHRAFPYAGTLGDGTEGQVAPTPAVVFVHQLAACGDDPLPRARRLLQTRTVVVAAPSPY